MVELKNLKVLYVEDEDTTRESMCRILNKFFREVMSAEDGHIGLEAYKNSMHKGTPPDIIISDINMPNMNGLDMIKEIRTTNQDIPIVLLTAHSEASFLLEAISLHVSEYVVKPMNMTILFEKLQFAYLPIHQKNLLEIQNLELKQLNEKIKDIAKKELEDMKGQLTGIDFNSCETIDFSKLIDNIEL